MILPPIWKPPDFSSVIGERGLAFSSAIAETAMARRNSAAAGPTILVVQVSIQFLGHGRKPKAKEDNDEESSQQHYCLYSCLLFMSSPDGRIPTRQLPT